MADELRTSKETSPDVEGFKAKFEDFLEDFVGRQEAAHKEYEKLLAEYKKVLAKQDAMAERCEQLLAKQDAVEKKILRVAEYFKDELQGLKEKVANLDVVMKGGVRGLIDDPVWIRFQSDYREEKRRIARYVASNFLNAPVRAFIQARGL